MSPAVEARGVRKEYGGLVAVDDLTFTVERGQILGVLGPNGAGKTSAIRVLTTILAPTGGTFAVAGVPYTRPAEIRRRIGVLPESAGYPEQQTGEEYLRYHARLFGHGKESARAVAAALLRGSRPVARAPRRSDRFIQPRHAPATRHRPGSSSTSRRSCSSTSRRSGSTRPDNAQVLTLVRRIARERGATVLLSTHFLAEVEETSARAS